MSNQTFISVGPYWDIVYRHRGVFFAIIAVGLVITALTVFLIPKQYTSSVLLEVWQSERPINRDDRGGTGKGYFDAAY